MVINMKFFLLILLVSTNFIAKADSGSLKYELAELDKGANEKQVQRTLLLMPNDFNEYKQLFGFGPNGEEGQLVNVQMNKIFKVLNVKADKDLLWNYYLSVMTGYEWDADNVGYLLKGYRLFFFNNLQLINDWYIENPAEKTRITSLLYSGPHPSKVKLKKEKIESVCSSYIDICKAIKKTEYDLFSRLITD